jgi:hypothetical protein
MFPQYIYGAEVYIHPIVRYLAIQKEDVACYAAILIGYVSREISTARLF